MEPDPPPILIGPSVTFAAVQPSYQNREFVADFATERARLSKMKMIQFGEQETAYQTWQPGYEFAATFVVQVSGLPTSVRRGGKALRSERNARIFAISCRC